LRAGGVVLFNGEPQCGQDGARLETCCPQSGQSTSFDGVFSMRFQLCATHPTAGHGATATLKNRPRLRLYATPAGKHGATRPLWLPAGAAVWRLDKLTAAGVMGGHGAGIVVNHDGQPASVAGEMRHVVRR